VLLEVNFGVDFWWISDGFLFWILGEMLALAARIPKRLGLQEIKRN